MMKKASSIPETIPRGPFTSMGCFHTAKMFDLPSLLKLIIDNICQNYVVNHYQLGKRKKQGQNRKTYIYAPFHFIIIQLLSQMNIHTTQHSNEQNGKCKHQKICTCSNTHTSFSLHEEKKMKIRVSDQIRVPCDPKQVLELALARIRGCHICLYVLVGIMTQSKTHPPNTTNTKNSLIAVRTFLIPSWDGGDELLTTAFESISLYLYLFFFLLEGCLGAHCDLKKLISWYYGECEWSWVVFIGGNEYIVY